MAKLFFRQEAIDDLNNIWNYTYDTWSQKQADHYYAALEFACRQIGENPALGKTYEEISPELQGLKAGKHIIFYQVITKHEVEIIRILHESMDLKNRLDE